MKKQSLKQHNNDFYQDKELNHHKLDQLLELTETINTSSNKKPQHNNWRAIAAILIVITIPFGLQQYATNKSHTQLVDQEIALNHSKQLTLEFNADNYISLSNKMSKLDFKLVKSNHTQLKELTILGSRYCSIQGNLAAQIRLTDNNGTIYTLYQTPITSTLKSAEIGEQHTQHVKITQWREGNLFLGLARSL